MVAEPKYRIGVLASGGGTTFETVYDATRTGELTDTQIAFVIANNGPSNPKAQVWEKARRLGVEIHHVSNKTQETCTVPIIGGVPVRGTISYEASERMTELAREYDIDMYVALGFMKKLVGTVLEQVPVANVHHGPLPETANVYGDDIDKAVMRQGLALSGPTFHWMDKRIGDDGLPIYDLDESNLDLRIGYEPVEVTDAMKQEWQEHGTATLLQAEDVRVEKLCVPGWIHMALEQLR